MQCLIISSWVVQLKENDISLSVINYLIFSILGWYLNASIACMTGSGLAETLACLCHTLFLDYQTYYWKKKIGFCQFFDFGYSFLLILTYYCNGFIVAQQTFVGLEDVLKTSLRHVLKMSWRPILKTSRRHDGDKQNTYCGYLYLINLNLYLTNLYFTRQYLTILRPIQNALIRI